MADALFYCNVALCLITDVLNIKYTDYIVYINMHWKHSGNLHEMHWGERDMLSERID